MYVILGLKKAIGYLNIPKSCPLHLKVIFSMQFSSSLVRLLFAFLLLLGEDGAVKGRWKGGEGLMKCRKWIA